MIREDGTSWWTIGASPFLSKTLLDTLRSHLVRPLAKDEYGVAKIFVNKQSNARRNRSQTEVKFTEYTCHND